MADPRQPMSFWFRELKNEAQLDFRGFGAGASCAGAAQARPMPSVSIAMVKKEINQYFRI
jgi:hypothetical protein